MPVSHLLTFSSSLCITISDKALEVVEASPTAMANDIEMDAIASAGEPASELGLPKSTIAAESTAASGLAPPRSAHLEQATAADNSGLSSGNGILEGKSLA